MENFAYMNSVNMKNQNSFSTKYPKREHPKRAQASLKETKTKTFCYNGRKVLMVWKTLLI